MYAKLKYSAVMANHVAYKQLWRKRREFWSSDKIKKSKVSWEVSLGKKYKDTKKKLHFSKKKEEKGLSKVVRQA